MGIVLFWLVAIPSAWSIGDADIWVAEKNGKEAWVQQQGKTDKKVLSAGDEIHNHDIVVTGSDTHIILSLKDGSKIDIAPGSRFQVLPVEKAESFWQWSFRLIIGTVRSLVRSVQNNQGTKFKVHTQAGTAGVRGTDFVVQFSTDSEEMKLHTLEGEVFLAKAGEGYTGVDTVIVRKSRRSRVKVGQSPEKPEAYIADEFEAFLKRVGFSTNLHLGPDQTKAKPAPQANQLSPRELGMQLFKAINSGNEKAAIALVDQGANWRLTDSDGNTAFQLAAKHKMNLLLVALLDKGVDLNYRNRNRRSAATLAAMYGDIETMMVLIEAKANVKLKDKFGKTAMHYACKRKDDPKKLICRVLRELRH